MCAAVFEMLHHLSPPGLCCNVGVAVCVLQCVAVRCSALQPVNVSVYGGIAAVSRYVRVVSVRELQFVAVCCSALQNVTVCCSVLQCVAVC